MLYGRQSQTDEESISLALQLTANREHAARHGYDVVAELEDPDISGRRWSNREKAVEALRMVSDREADVIVVWKWSRLSRRRLDFEVALDTAETAGGRIESATEPVDVTTASGRFARGMLAQVADFESERIGEGWKETHASRRGRGLPAQGGDRYGYRRAQVRDEVSGKLRTTGYEVDETQAEALRLAYGWYVSGWGADRIVGTLNDRGFRNRAGEPFKRFGLYGLLDSGFAAGLIVHTPRGPDGKPVGEPEYSPGAHPAIITEETWEAYCAERRRRATEPPRRVSSPHPLSGLLRCGDCGASMAVFLTPRPPRPSVYACVRWRNWGPDYVRPVMITTPRAERMVRAWVADIAESIEAAAAADGRLQRHHRQARAVAERAVRTVADVESQLAELAVLRVRGEVSPVGYDQARARLEAEREIAASAAEEAELAATREPPEARATAGRLLRLWPAPGTMLVPASDIRAILGTLLRGVWVFPSEQRRGAPSTLRIVPIGQDPPTPAHLDPMALRDDPGTDDEDEATDQG